MAENIDHARVIAPPPLITALCIAAGASANHFLPLRIVSDFTRARQVTAAVVIVIAALLIAGGLQQLISSRQHPSPYKPTEAIVGRGVYRFTRNPIYAGFFMIAVGVALVLNAIWVLLSAVVLFLLLQFGVVKPEERYLSAKFGSSYDEYCRRVRRWI